MHDLDSELEIIPELTQLDFVINKKEHFLICTTCHKAILISIALDHAQGHDMSGSTPSMFNSYIGQQFLLWYIPDIYNSFADITDIPLVYISIKILDGYACPQYPYTCYVKGFLQIHLANEYSNNAPPINLKTSKIQNSKFTFPSKC